MSSSWAIDRCRGSAADFHLRQPPAGVGRRASWFEVERPALALGSTQHLDAADAEACARHGVEVLRRASGGGAVLLVPGESLWLDVVVPAGDPLWLDDVGRAMWWFGGVWVEALAACGVSASVHHGALVSSTWSRLVCFDGVGAGEVLVGGHKAVGVSQRRTRTWIRLQSSLHLAWRPDLLVELLAPPRPTAAELAAPYVFPGDAARLRTEVERALAAR